MAYTRDDFENKETQEEVRQIAAAQGEEEKSATPVAAKKYEVSDLEKRLVALPLFFLLNKIPADISLRGVLPFLALASESDNENYHKLACIQKPISFLFREDMGLKQLLQHIAYGQKEQVKNILEKAKAVSLDKLFNLLSRKGPIVKDYAGYERQQSAWQIARWNRDVFVSFKKGEYQPDAQGEEMLEMLERYLRMCAGGEAEIERQQTELFPPGCAEAQEKKIAEGFKMVTEVFEALHQAQATDEEGLVKDKECQAALEKLKEYLQPKGIIRTGEDVNSEIHNKAQALYDDYYQRFGNDWDTPKNQVAWQKVVGFIQRYLTACDAMALCQGPYYIVHEGEKFKRTLSYRYGGGVYFPLDLDPDWVLGKNCAGHAGGRLGQVARGRRAGHPHRGVQAYVEQKQRHCKNLCNTQDRRLTPHAGVS